MARPLRIEYPAGAHYHVMSRENERRAIVRDDRERWMDWLRRTVEMYGWRLHAFVLMTNHDHLFVETPDANLSVGMQYFNGSYTSYCNRRHRRSGHLFQGRYKAHLIEEEGYFLAVSRYIHLNPVRAKIVVRPEQYRWSSYPGYHRIRKSVNWVVYNKVLDEFDGSPQTVRAAYRRYVAAGVKNRLQSPFRDAFQGVVSGGEDFIRRIGVLLRDASPDTSIPELDRLRDRPTLLEIQESVCAEFDTDSSYWLSGRRCDDASRAVASYLARRVFGHRPKEIAAAYGYSSSGGVGQAIRPVESSVLKLRASASCLEKRLKRSH